MQLLCGTHSPMKLVGGPAVLLRLYLRTGERLTGQLTSSYASLTAELQKRRVHGVGWGGERRSKPQGELRFGPWRKRIESDLLTS